MKHEFEIRFFLPRGARILSLYAYPAKNRASIALSPFEVFVYLGIALFLTR